MQYSKGTESCPWNFFTQSDKLLWSMTLGGRKTVWKIFDCLFQKCRRLQYTWHPSSYTWDSVRAPHRHGSIALVQDWQGCQRNVNAPGRYWVSQLRSSVQPPGEPSLRNDRLLLTLQDLQFTPLLSTGYCDEYEAPNSFSIQASETSTL